MDLRQAIIEFLAVALPAVAFYFIGWAYLSSYLALFGVNISELSLDLPTILIYSYSPLSAFVRAQWLGLSIFTAALAALIYIVWRVLPSRFWREATRRVPAALKWTGALILILGAVLLLVIPVAHWGAHRAAEYTWNGGGVLMDVPVSAGSADQWIENYRKCADRRGLELVFSDENTFYLLCRSLVDTDAGVVYQVRREGELISIRYVRRPLQ